jgi:hypothetical protein
MTSDLYPVAVKRALVPLPPIFHPLLSFKVRDRKNNRNLLIPEEVVKEPVIVLQRSSHSASVNAE